MQKTKKILFLLILTYFFIGSSQSIASSLVTYDISGSTDMGSSFSMTFTVDLNEAPFELNSDYAFWHPVSCSFTINGQAYTGDPNYSDFLQDNGYWTGSPFTSLHCGDVSSGRDIFVDFAKPTGFNNIGVAEKLDLPATLMMSYVDGENAVAPVTVTEDGDETESDLVTYNVSGTTDMGSNFSMTFTVDLTAAPFESSSDYAGWQPVSCSFSINGQSYSGDPNYSEFFQDNGYLPDGPFNALHCGDASGEHNLFLVIAKPSGFNNVGVAEKFDLPAVLRWGDVEGEQIVDPITIADDKSESGIVTYNVSGTTEMGSSFSMSFTVDLSAAPLESYPDYAIWNMVSCSFTINGQSYAGDPDYIDFIQDNGYLPEAPVTHLHCGDISRAHNIFLEFAKPTGFNYVGVAEKLDLPAMLQWGDVDGDPVIDPVNVTEVEEEPASDIITYDVSGTTDMGNSFTMTYTVDLTEVPYESYPDYALWHPVSCSFTINGQAYTGDPNYSEFIQDNGYWATGPFTLLHCGDVSGGHNLFLDIAKPSGFNNVSIAEKLDLPAVLQNGDLDGEQIVDPVTVTEGNGDEVEPEIITYNVSGTTDMGSSFSMIFTVDLTAAPFESYPDYAFWHPVNCSFTINGQAYTGDPNYSDFVQDNGYWSDGPFTSLHCGDGTSGHDIFIDIAKPTGFNNIGVAEGIDLPAVLMMSYVDGEWAIDPITVVAE